MAFKPGQGPRKSVGPGLTKAYCPVVETYCCSALKPGAIGVPALLFLAEASMSAASLSTDRACSSVMSLEKTIEGKAATLAVKSHKAVKDVKYFIIAKDRRNSDRIPGSLNDGSSQEKSGAIYLT
jgi:hypothetical protein